MVSYTMHYMKSILMNAKKEELLNILSMYLNAKVDFSMLLAILAFTWQ